MPLSYPDVVWCREAADRLPQPIAYSMGRIARAPRDVEPLDWVVRTVETIARYAGLVGAASFAARADPTVPAPWRKKRFKQGLSLNSFFSVAQDAANTAVDHPLRAVLNAALGSEEEAPATTAFGRAMEFRNRNAHGLQGMSEAKARSLLGEMVDYLRTIVSALQPLLDLPLIVIDQQIHQRGSIIARILPLVGEREPFPIDVELDRAAHDRGSRTSSSATSCFF